MDGAMSSDFVDISIFNRSFSVLSPDGKWFQKTTPCIRPRLVVRKSSIPEIINLLFHGAFYRSKYPESSGLWRASLNPKEIINIICDSGLGLGPDPDGVLPQHSTTTVWVTDTRTIENSKNELKSGQKMLNTLIFIVKLREREGQRVDLGRSLKGHLWMVDGGWWYTFPWCFTLNLVATTHLPASL